MFVNAANDLLVALVSQSVYQTTQQHTNQQQKTKSYGEFKKFQEDCKQVDRFCYKLFQIIQSCTEHSLVSNSLNDEVIKVSRKIQSHGFRVAVLGEFSQGKSTLLNALIGEKIQPVRAIPCSGAITVLKHGSKREIICRYKDGREEEISLEQYQVKASIPKEAACNGLSDGLANSNIAEIIFKHPDLELCRNGVEIIDSPGLNEHPERTSITQKLLKDTDAVIFLGNASRPLTQWEKDYLVKDLRFQLNGGKDNLPADNLFVVVNFMDLLDEEEDRQDVTKRFHSFVHGNSPIITGVNRLHFVSAKAALKSIVDGIEDEHSKTFQGFTKSLEQFLTLERGRLKIKQSIVNLDNLVKSSLNELAQAEAILDGKIKLSEGEQHKILENIGEASGRDFKINLLKNELLKPIEQQIMDSWNHWLGVEDEGLKKRLKEKSKTWTSEHSPIWNRDKLAEDYARQFNEALSEELKLWINKRLKEAILMPPLKILDNSIEAELKQIKAGIKSWNQQINTKLPTYMFINENSKATADEWFLGSLGFAGLAVALIPVIVIAGPLVTIIAGVSAGMFGTVGVSMMASVSNTIKEKVFDFGYEQFSASIIKTISQIKNSAKTEFEERVNKASEVIAEAISFYQGILEQQEKAHKETLQEREAEKAFITEQRQQLEQVQKEMEVILNQIGV